MHLLKQKKGCGQTAEGLSRNSPPGTGVRGAGAGWEEGATAELQEWGGARSEQGLEQRPTGKAFGCGGTWAQVTSRGRHHMSN